MSAVKPAIPDSTYRLSHSLGMQFTIGRSVVAGAGHRILTQSGGTTAVDIETYGLGADACRIKCVTIAHAGEAVIVDPRDEFQANLIRNLISDLDVLIFHNSAFDVPNLTLNGLMRPTDIAKVEDTLIYARLAEPDELVQKNLAAVATRYLGLDPSGITMNQVFKELGMKITEGWRNFDLDRPCYIYGAAWDALVTARLRDPVKHAAHSRLTTGHPFGHMGLDSSTAWDLVEREQVINRLFLRRSARGLRIDEEFLDRYTNQQHEERQKAFQVLNSHGVVPAEAVNDRYGIPSQLITCLGAAGVVPSNHPRTSTGRLSTAKQHLTKIDHPVAQAHLAIKEIDKILHDYLKTAKASAVNGRVHPEVNLLKAVTGRMSISSPAFHQWPGEARGSVLADEGDQLSSIDWSQIEPVIAANIAKDYGALAEYELGTGDMYAGIATHAGVERSKAKTILLASLYGGGITLLAESLGVSTDEARELKASIFNAMTGVANLLKKISRIAEQHRVVFTLSGRIIPVPSMTNDEGFEKVLAYKAINYLVQGSAYDVLAETLVKIEDTGLGDAVYLAIHDELVVSTSAARDIQQIMETPPERLTWISGRLPVLRTDRADLGERWAVA